MRLPAHELRYRRLLGTLAAIRRRLNARGFGRGEGRLGNLLVLSVGCPAIERARRRGKAYYFAHAGHHGECATICVSEVLGAVPAAVRRGVLWHEVGHLIADRKGVGGVASADDLDNESRSGMSPRATRAWRRFVREAGRVYPTVREAREQARANYAVWITAGVRIRYDRRGVEVAR